MLAAYRDGKIVGVCEIDPYFHCGNKQQAIDITFVVEPNEQGKGIALLFVELGARWGIQHSATLMIAEMPTSLTTNALKRLFHSQEWLTNDEIHLTMDLQKFAEDNGLTATSSPQRMSSAAQESIPAPR